MISGRRVQLSIFFFLNVSNAQGATISNRGGKGAQQATSKPTPQLKCEAPLPPRQPQTTEPPAEGPAQQASTSFGLIDS